MIEAESKSESSVLKSKSSHESWKAGGFKEEDGKISTESESWTRVQHWLTQEVNIFHF